MRAQNDGESPAAFLDRLSGPRVAVIGTTGSGKTTFAGELSKALEIEHIELDALHWEPGWQPAELQIFQARVREALSAAAWVVDGNYGKVRDIVWPRAELIVWLDYPFRTTMGRLLRRTFRRSLTKEALWNDNRERLRDAFFSRDSILLWMLKTFGRRRREYPLLFVVPEHRHLKIVRLRSPGEAKTWLQGVRAGQLAKSEKVA